MPDCQKRTTMSNSTGNLTSPLIHRLDDAVSRLQGKPLCESVKSILSEELTQQGDLLDERLLAVSSDGYARRLLHRDPEGRYSVLVMVWGPGQQTPLHDHGGLWCVEGVYRGRIRGTSYDRIETGDDDCVRFVQVGEIHAGVGEAGSLIPPVDYHAIDNPNGETAATVHVYGGDMVSCNVFEPVMDDLYRGRSCQLEFSRD